MEFFRTNFPGKVLPKMHILEDHCNDWISNYTFGLAFHGEQGGESIHAEFNKLERTAWGVRDPVKQLMVIMKEHHLKTAPEIQVSIPLKTRKRKIESQ